MKGREAVNIWKMRKLRKRSVFKLAASLLIFLICYNCFVLFRYTYSEWKQENMNPPFIRTMFAELPTSPRPDRNTIHTETTENVSISPSKTLLTAHRELADMNVQRRVIANQSKNAGKAFLVIGVPTVKRGKADYLSGTLTSLVHGLDEEERKQVLVVVMVTAFDKTAFQEIVTKVTRDFNSEVQEGLIRVAQVQKSFYPIINDLPHLWKDNAERVKWRSKQCLDYAFLFNYAQDLGEYYLQIEDDVMATTNYFEMIKQSIQANEGRPWSVLEFGTTGFIGILYRNRDLGHLSMFVKMYHWVFPVDILFRHYNDFQLHGNPAFARHTTPLFKHIGRFSSLEGQFRKLEDIHPGDRVHVDSNNPPCTITTSITEHEGKFDIGGPYRKENIGVFWGKGIKVGDFILLNFTKPLAVIKVNVDTGISSSPEDYLGGGKLETSTPDLGGACNTFTLWKVFSSTPQLVADSDDKQGKVVKCLRLTITDLRKDQSGRPRWLAIREIAVWVLHESIRSTRAA